MSNIIEYNKEFNWNVFRTEIDEYIQYMDEIFYNIRDKKLICSWKNETDQIILNEFQTLVNDHNINSVNQKYYKIYRYTKDKHNKFQSPCDINFVTDLTIGLEKGEVDYNHKGQPNSVIYYKDGEEIVKREWTFKMFVKDTIMTELGVDEATALAMEDLLIWKKDEKYSWALESGEWGEETKTMSRNYVPFNEGVPDIISKYVERVEERQRGRTILIQEMQLEIVQLIIQTNGDSVDEAREKARSLSSTHSIMIKEYVDNGTIQIEDDIANDVTHVWLDNMSGLGITIRHFIINRLRQVTNILEAL